MSELIPQYEALLHGIGVADFSERTRIQLAGPDAVAFLHNLCTNDIKKLNSGDGCEAFLTNVQGKIIGFVNVLRLDESLWLETTAGQAERLLAHLDRYLIRENVQLQDGATQWSEWLVSGAEVPRVLAEGGASLPQEPLGVAVTTLFDHAVTLCRIAWSSAPSFVVLTPAGAEPAWLAALEAAGAVRCGAEATEVARVEAALPLYGRDISEKNLPQEVARDKQAISFVKGCYLGQETVARIDALGHVNRTLVQVRFESNEVPAAGTALQSGEKPVGEVTSAVWSPKHDAPLALAYLRRGSNTPGSRLQSELGEAVVEG